MPTKRIKQLILNLPFEQKILGTGSLLMLASLFMPWYQDVDVFQTGDTFLGITGPLYLLGFSIMLMTFLNIGLLIMEALEIKIPFKIKSSQIYLASGIVCFYLLILANSVFFSAKFGVNLTNKTSPFGMFISFISASLITIGGYLASRDKKAILKEFQEIALESDVIDTTNLEARKPKENIRTMNVAQPVRVTQPITQSPANTQNAPVKKKVEVANFYRPAVTPDFKPAESEPAMPKKEPQPYRMDL